MAELPSLDHLHYTAFEEVYEPAEDTFLLCDGLLEDKGVLLARGHGQVVCELGSGSGTVITYLALLMDDKHKCRNVYLALDVNVQASRMTQGTALHNGAKVDSVNSSLFSGFRLPLGLDVLVFNPPYVPTPSEEVQSQGIEAAWAGGKQGREVIDQFLPLLPRLLAPTGCCYMILVEENRPADVSRVLAQLGFTGEVIKSKRARNELLHVMKIVRS